MIALNERIGIRTLEFEDGQKAIDDSVKSLHRSKNGFVTCGNKTWNGTEEGAYRHDY